MTQASENKSAQDMITLFENVIDHGTAAHADALFDDVKQSTKQTRDDIYTLLEARALDQATKDIAAWNDFQFKAGPKLDEPEYSTQRRALVKDLARLKPLAQIFCRLSQEKGKEANTWIRNFAAEFAVLTPENKHSIEALADSLAATKRLPAPRSTLAAAHAEAADKVTTPARDIASENQAQLKDISAKRKHINTGMKP